MSHIVYGFIGAEAAMSEVSRSLPDASVCPMRKGLAFLPLAEEAAGPTDADGEFKMFDRLTTSIAAWAREQSLQFPIAYVETEYFGGEGSQRSIVWCEGHITFGPLTTSDFYGRPTPLLDGAINQAMRHLGVDRGAHRDEFEALGLGLHRSNASWIAEAGRNTS